MKSFKPILVFFSLIAIVISSCSSDDESPSVNSSPEFTTLTTDVSSLGGEEFLFQAEISDPAGIKWVNIKYEPWFLDKTIIKDSLPTNYSLSYKFEVPEDAAKDSQHTILLTVANAGGNETSQNVTVTLDADIEAPQIAVADPLDGGTALITDGNEIQFNITLTDEELSEFKIESDVLTETISYSGTSATYTNAVNIDTPGLYEFTFTATDVTGNVSQASASINVVDELKFLQMYLADVATDEDLNNDLTGIPYLAAGSAEPDEEGFVFTLGYYAEEANQEVRFIPQKTSFAPFTFGVDPDNEGQLVIGADASAAPIVLGEAGYYEISMDLRDLSYSATRYTPPAPEPFGGDFLGVYMAGTGLMVGGEELAGWTHATAIEFEVDPNNPLRYSQTVEFIEDVTGQFIFVGNRNNWNKFWRLDVGTMKDMQAIVPQGGANGEADAADPVYTGTFLVTIDLHLLTFEATKI